MFLGTFQHNLSKVVVAARSVTRSKCTARVTQHVNKAMYAFTISPVLNFTNKGPAKSIPTLEKGLASLTL